MAKFVYVHQRSLIVALSGTPDDAYNVYLPQVNIKKVPEINLGNLDGR